jgi:hypothetical protein
MHLEGFTAFLFVIVLALLFFVLGMAYASWVFLIRLRKHGLTFNEKLELIKLPDASVEPDETEALDGTPQEEESI